MKIGVLALQGAFREHVSHLEKLGVEAAEIRLPDQLGDTDGLIIPGGESTTMGKLAEEYGLMPALHDYAKTHAVWGVCAGMILLSNDSRTDQPLLGLLDMGVERNAFGRQIQSFSTQLKVPCLENGDNRPFPAIFIRAPKIRRIGPEVKTLAILPDGSPAAVRQGRLLACAFHPELTHDPRFHRYFLSLAKPSKNRPVASGT